MMLSLVVVVVAAASPAPSSVLLSVRVAQAGLVAPGAPSSSPIGSLRDADVTLGAWVTKTRVFVERHGRVFDVSADIDLDDAGTEVVVGVTRAVQLSDTGDWVIGLSPDARVPLIGGDSGGVDVAFLKSQFAPVPRGRLNLAAVPFALRGTEEPCLISSISSAPNARASSFSPASFIWTLFAAGPKSGAWRPVQARGGIVVEGFVNDADVHCGGGSGGGFGISGSGAGGGDGTLQAREAMLPPETRVFGGDPHVVIAVFHRSVRALQMQNGTWRIPALNDGGATLILNGVSVDVDVDRLKLGPLKLHGVGSTTSSTDGWPHLTTNTAP